MSRAARKASAPPFRLVDISPEISEVFRAVSQAEDCALSVSRAANAGVIRLGLGQCRAQLLRGIHAIDTARAALDLQPGDQT